MNKKTKRKPKLPSEMLELHILQDPYPWEPENTILIPKEQISVYGPPPGYQIDLDKIWPGRFSGPGYRVLSLTGHRIADWRVTSSNDKVEAWGRVEAISSDDGLADSESAWLDLRVIVYIKKL